MSSKSNISNFKKDWLAQSTLNRPLVVMSEGEPKLLRFNKRVTEIDLRVEYCKDVGGQHKHGQVSDLYRNRLTGYARWVEEKLIELLNEQG